MKKFAKYIVLLAMLLCLCSCTQRPGPAAETKSENEIIQELIQAYGDEALIENKLEGLRQMNADTADKWQRIMDHWAEINAAELSYERLPDGIENPEKLCIVVLGFQLNEDGSMRDELVGRLETALNCANQYPESYVLCTGGGTASRNPEATEAGEMGRWLAENGVSPERIIVENNSLSTVQNAQFSCHILMQDHPEVNRVAIVTSDYHVPWGAALFETQFILAESTIEVAYNAAFAADNPGYNNITAYQTSGIRELAFSQRMQPYPTAAPIPEVTPQPEEPEPTEELRGEKAVELDLVDAYGNTEKIAELLTELREINPAAGEKWTRIMNSWMMFNNVPANYGLLPEGIEHPEKLCIIVPGFRLNEDGSMSVELLGRLQTALACAWQYPQSHILCTGGGTAEENEEATEAGEMAKWLEAMGISKDRIIVEDNSFSTVQNAYLSYYILMDEYPEVDSIAIVSSDYHVPWCASIFETLFILEDCGIEVTCSAAFHVEDPEEKDPFYHEVNGIMELAGLHREEGEKE